MNIKEQFIASKINDLSRCEDGIFINNHYIAVIDGVTPKGKMKWNGATSGYYAKEVIKQAIATLNGRETMVEAFQRINDALLCEYDDLDFFQSHTEERLQATLVVYSAHARQIWRYGDCQFMINDDLYQYEMKIDDLVAEFRAIFLELEMMAGKTLAELCREDPSQAVIFPLLERQMLLANADVPYGFQVMDGFCKDFGDADVWDVPAGSTVVLASDGYPKLFGTLAESEQYLDNLREKDPLCMEIFKSTRGFTDGKASLDDRSYIRADV